MDSKKQKVDSKRAQSAGVVRNYPPPKPKPDRSQKPSETTNDQMVNTLRGENETLKLQLERANMTIEKRTKERDQIKEELSEVKSRLSKVISDQIKDGNSDIADLGDENRPTKIAEKYLQLYDNQWTDALEVLSEHFDDKIAIEMLLDILMKARKHCDDTSTTLTLSLTNAITMSKESEVPTLSSFINKQIKDIKRMSAGMSVTNVYKMFMTQTPKLWPSPHPINKVLRTSEIQAYIKECITVCWFMSLQDPPVELDGNMKHSDHFDSAIMKYYLLKGPFLDFLVWPPLFLKKGGPLLSKGIGQGMSKPSELSSELNEKNKFPELIPESPRSREESLHGAKPKKAESGNVKPDGGAQKPQLVKEKPKIPVKCITDKKGKPLPGQNTAQNKNNFVYLRKQELRKRYKVTDV